MAISQVLILDGVDGECNLKGYEKSIQLQSFAWGVTNLSSVALGGGSGSGRANLKEITVGKHLDASSTKLAGFACSGKHIKQAVFKAFKAGSSADLFFTATVSSALITGWDVDYSTEFPVETVKFTFEIITLEYKGQLADGRYQAMGAVTVNLKTGTVT